MSYIPILRVHLERATWIWHQSPRFPYRSPILLGKMLFLSKFCALVWKLADFPPKFKLFGLVTVS